MLADKVVCISRLLLKLKLIVQAWLMVILLMVIQFGGEGVVDQSAIKHALLRQARRDKG
jgi:hypothetical protein